MMLMFPLLLLLLIDRCHALAKPPRMRSVGRSALDKLRGIRSTIAPFTLPWYENGLAFDCTGCGKCCKVDGDVWLSPEEVEQIMHHLSYDEKNATSVDEFRKIYVRAEVSPSDTDLDQPLQSWMCLRREEGSCIFLDPLGRCSIYDVRPIQCSTYPFWPSLLKSKEVWEEESVLPDDVTIGEGTNDRHWSPELGGCEGILPAKEKSGQAKSIGINADTEDGKEEEPSIVGRQEIVAKMRAAKRHWKRFPVQEIKETSWYL